jgi:hypothetical protein
MTKRFLAGLLSIALVGAAVSPPLAAAIVCPPPGGPGGGDDPPAASTCCCPPESGARCQTDSGRGAGAPSGCCDIAPTPHTAQGVVPAAAPAPTLARAQEPVEDASASWLHSVDGWPASDFSDAASPPPAAARSRLSLLSILLI